MKLLHIDASITGDTSVSRQISKAVVDRLREGVSDLEVTYCDLTSAPIPHLAGPPAPEGEAELEEFVGADIVVIGAPMYNFTVPTQLKAWIDRVLIAGKTFRYGPNGPEGLAGNKRVIIAISRGGLYGTGSPAASAEHVESYLRAVFGFIGINPEFIVAEGIMMGPEQREKAVAEALQAATSLRAA
jgi:FMN-dependent NADH-azoreductase